MIENTYYYPNKNERNLIFMARRLAVTSSVKKGKHCAFALGYKGEIVNVFVNTPDSHAEYGLMKMSKNQQIQKVIVIRATRNDNLLSNSKPCDNCTQAMINSGVKCCVFSIHENRFSSHNYN